MGKGERASWRKEYEEKEPILKTFEKCHMETQYCAHIQHIKGGLNGITLLRRQCLPKHHRLSSKKPGACYGLLLFLWLMMFHRFLRML